MIEFRCKNCNKVLFEGEFTGTVKKICPKCKQMNTFIEKKFEIKEKFCNVEKLN